jgi:hypothetical protein
MPSNALLPALFQLSIIDANSTASHDLPSSLISCFFFLSLFPSFPLSFFMRDCVIAARARVSPSRVKLLKTLKNINLIYASV